MGIRECTLEALDEGRRLADSLEIPAERRRAARRAVYRLHQRPHHYKRGKIFTGDPEDAAGRIVQFLIEKGLI